MIQFRRQVSIATLRVLAVLGVLAPLGAAQSFQFAPAQIPQGAPFNNSYSENFDFGDLDLDGDQDAVVADGDCCNDQNRLWVNMGFAQGGTLGYFEDRTAQQFPAILDTTRDMDLVDYDSDGDLDIGVVNTSSSSNQTSRFWTNMGGFQGGTAGFFQDQTALRWQELALNNGSTQCSSMPQAQVLASGGFIDWNGDSVYGDLDNDGDLDLVHASYGPALSGVIPSRIFFNDGQGFFREFNPSCHQQFGIAVTNGQPALWAQGTFLEGTTNVLGESADIANTPMAVELGDFDGDFDIDFVLGSCRTPPPRLFRNMFAELGSLVWRDRTFAQLDSPPISSTSYEQEMGDMNGDGDLDLLGINWNAFFDRYQDNDGTGVFGTPLILPNSSTADMDGELLDFNGDGNLDVLVANTAGPERLHAGDGLGALVDVSSTELPLDSSSTRCTETCDIDQDGDFDVMVANNLGEPNDLLLSVGTGFDSHPALLPRLEQAPSRAPSAQPTVVRVHAYDNCSWDVMRYNKMHVQYQVDGGEFTDQPMRHAGGQLFRGEIPGTLVGQIAYRVKSRDEHGNVAFSALLSYTAANPNCTGNLSSYCTSKVSSSGCLPVVGATGVPALNNPAGFVITSSSLEANKNGLQFFGTTGEVITPFQDGWLCVAPPLHRLAVKASGGGAACSGALSYTLAEVLASESGGALVVVGQLVNQQGWFRDPAAPSATGLTHGLRYIVCP